MRLKSEIWVKAYVRRCAVAGVPAMVVRHGDDDAGAIFIKIATLDGRAALFGPAPAGFDAGQTDRQWTLHLDPAKTSDADVEAYLARQAEFDEDLWVVEVEDRQGRHFLDDWM
jgi:hypothetical protein